MSRQNTMKQETLIDGAVITGIAGFSLTQIDAVLTTAGLAIALFLGLLRVIVVIRQIVRGWRK